MFWLFRNKIQAFIVCPTFCIHCEKYLYGPLLANTKHNIVFSVVKTGVLARSCSFRGRPQKAERFARFPRVRALVNVLSIPFSEILVGAMFLPFLFPVPLLVALLDVTHYTIFGGMIVGYCTCSRWEQSKYGDTSPYDHHVITTPFCGPNCSINPLIFLFFMARRRSY